MSVIIRLQNLALTAGSSDIRKFFGNLQIPGGGVHIIGGKYGDAFVAFVSETEGRLALKLSGRQLCNEVVYLYPSNVEEMNAVIDGKDVKPTAINVVDDSPNPLSNPLIGNTYFSLPTAVTPATAYNPDPSYKNSKGYNYSYSTSTPEEVDRLKRTVDNVLKAESQNLINNIIDNKIMACSTKKARLDPRIRVKEPPTEYNLSTSKISLADESLSLLNGIINNVKKLPPGLNNTSLNKIPANMPVLSKPIHAFIKTETINSTIPVNIPNTINQPIKKERIAVQSKNINEGKVLLGDRPVPTFHVHSEHFLNSRPMNGEGDFVPNMDYQDNFNEENMRGRGGFRGRGTLRGGFDGVNENGEFGQMGRGGFEMGRGKIMFNGPRGGFDGSRGRGGFDNPRGRGRYDSQRGRGGFDGPRGRGGFDSLRGRGGFDNPRGRGCFDGPRGRGGFDHIRGEFDKQDIKDEFGIQKDSGKGEFGSQNDSGKGKFSNNRGNDESEVNKDSEFDESQDRNICEGRGGFDSTRGRGGQRGRGGFDSQIGRGGCDGPRGRGGFDGPLGRGGYDGPRGRGGFDSPRGRGGFDGPLGRGGYDGPRGRGGFDSSRGRGGFDGPRGRGGFDSPRGRGGFDGPRGRGGFDGPRGRGGFDGPRGRGGFDSPRGRLDGPMGRGGFDNIRGRNLNVGKSGFDVSRGRDDIDDSVDMCGFEGVMDRGEFDIPNNIDRKRKSEEPDNTDAIQQEAKKIMLDEEIMRAMKECKDEVEKEQKSTCIHMYNLPKFVKSKDIKIFLGEDCEISEDGVTRLKIITNSHSRRSSDAYIFFKCIELTKKALSFNKKNMSGNTIYVRLCSQSEFEKAVSTEMREKRKSLETDQDSSRNSLDRSRQRHKDCAKKQEWRSEKHDKYIYIRGLPVETTLSSVKSFLGDAKIIESATSVYESREKLVSCVTEMCSKRDLNMAMRLHKTLFKTSECVSVYTISDEEYETKRKYMKG